MIFASVEITLLTGAGSLARPRIPNNNQKAFMEDSFAKVMSLAVFIVLGYLLRRFNILKDQAFAAISALVMNVTLPCVILTNLNGVKIQGDMLLIAGLGLLTNVIFLVWGLILTRNITDAQWRDFVRLNIGGYSVGPFAVPYVQSFFPTTGLMATCMLSLIHI